MSTLLTNALGWVVSTGPSWIEEVAADFQIEKWVLRKRGVRSLLT